MSFEHHPARSEPAAAIGMDGSPRGPPDASNYWHALIDEKEAGRFLGLTDRTMQAYRHRGGGPRYIRLSSRCLRAMCLGLRTLVTPCQLNVLVSKIMQRFSFGATLA